MAYKKPGQIGGKVRKLSGGLQKISQDRLENKKEAFQPNFTGSKVGWNIADEKFRLFGKERSKSASKERDF